MTEETAEQAEIAPAINPAFIVKIIEVAKYLKQAWDELGWSKKKLTMAMENYTQEFTLVFSASSTSGWYGWGRFERAPDGIIPPDMAEVMSAVDADYSVATGILGYVVYDVFHAGTEDGSSDALFTLVMCFNNPFIGTFKTVGAIKDYPCALNAALKKEMSDKKSEDGGHVDRDGYRYTWSSGAPEEIFSFQKLPESAE